MTDDDDDTVALTAEGNAAVIGLTVVAVVLIVCGFGSCLYHCEGQADRRLQCIEMVHDVEKCSTAFEGNK